MWKKEFVRSIIFILRAVMCLYPKMSLWVMCGFERRNSNLPCYLSISRIACQLVQYLQSEFVLLPLKAITESLNLSLLKYLDVRRHFPWCLCEKLLNLPALRSLRIKGLVGAMCSRKYILLDRE